MNGDFSAHNIVHNNSASKIYDGNLRPGGASAIMCLTEVMDISLLHYSNKRENLFSQGNKGMQSFLCLFQRAGQNSCIARSKVIKMLRWDLNVSSTSEQQTEY